MSLLNVFIFLIVFILLIIPIGKHISKLILHEKTIHDSLFSKMEKVIFKVTGNENMNLKAYIIAFLGTNLIMFILTYIILSLDGSSPSLAFNTAVSFVTNTNLQHYSGEWLNGTMSRLALINLMFTSAASGLAISMAIIRGILKIRLGNFFEDLTKSITRLLLPLSILVAISLVVLGIPQTFATHTIVKTIEGQYQVLTLGPVAAWEAIKHLGTNGGGIFSANSSHPFENISLYTNYIEMMCMMVIPGATIIGFGMAAKNKKQGWFIFLPIFTLFLFSFFMLYHFEKQGVPLFSKYGLNGINMEGKEMRFGLIASVLFTDITTSFTTGSVNNMHDSLTPIGGMMPLWNMMLNCIFGGKGVGFMNILMYMMLSVFLCGLMVGRTPEFFGKKLEAREMQIITFLILIHPIIILVPSAISLISNLGTSGITNSGFHGISQVLYEYTSSAANNGSGFEGLGDGTTFWNIMTGIVMLLGRYISMVLMVIVGYSLYKKQSVPVNISTFKTDNLTFSFILFFIILIIGALTFLPALALGPIAEHLSIWG
ncbi:potassium-transporting ATPase subunit KdpA [Fusobacterium varium]|jgi:K+-transporting ATPase ATPase A chain|uniref:Potassium-transporting ATPase potassium-binding subunit n=1 Tax=Fusobacterium varium ATCC 27725 TaxID=469618 RepID=A0ABM6U1V5_FUSVA|nr:potassium-transporting ATPase subunit KdpA [Fusobacterium varium]AVQ30267.1 potassium-transporting ATPase subunit A [Fusobacterium varium ATCC 27725]EES64699.1 K+-transporting ATPase, A subunit [Fusobacterium varium ATCC 27725]